jgi:hypothetical protein
VKNVLAGMLRILNSFRVVREGRWEIKREAWGHLHADKYVISSGQERHMDGL